MDFFLYCLFFFSPMISYGFFYNFFRKMILIMPRLPMRHPMRLLLLLIITAVAPPARAAGFESYLAMMLNNDPTLKAALYDVYSKGQLYDGSVSAMFNPSVALVGSFGQTYATTTDPVPSYNYSGNYSRNSYSLQLNQNLFNGGKDSLAIQQARALFHLSEWSYLATEQGMILQAALAYTNVIKARQAYQLQRWNNDIVARALTAARIRFRGGIITTSDLAQSEALKSQNDAMLFVVQGNVRSANDEFTRIFGTAPANNLPPIDTAVNDIATFIKTRNENSKENWVRDFQTRNPQLQMARLQKTVANIQKDSNVNSFLPRVDFSLTANLSDTTQPNTPSTSKSLSGVINVTQPLWFNGQLLSGSRAVIAAAKVADFQFLSTSQKLKQQFNRSYQDYQTALLSERSYIQAVASSRLAARAANIEYNSGKKTLIDFLQTTNANLLNELNLLNAEQNKIIAMLNLQMMTGDLIASNFGLRSPYRTLTEQNLNYRGPLDPFAAVSEWIFTSPDADITQGYPKQFKEKPKKQ